MNFTEYEASAGQLVKSRLGAGGKLLPVLLVALPLLSSCGDKKVPPPKLTYSGPVMETENVTELFSDSARLQLKLTAPLQQQYDNGDLLWTKGVLVNFYAKDGSLVNTLAAKYGKMDKMKNLYIMRGDVRVDNQVKQQKMRTEELFFDNAKGQIYTDTAMFVTVTTPVERLTGYGLTAKQDFSYYKIRRPTGIFALDTSPTAPKK